MFAGSHSRIRETDKILVFEFYRIFRLVCYLHGNTAEKSAGFIYNNFVPKRTAHVCAVNFECPIISELRKQRFRQESS